MDFDDLMDAAQGAYRSGRNAAKKGVWYVALYEYGHALGLLEATAILIDNGTIRIDEQQRQALVALIGGVQAEHLKSSRLSGNGHPKQNPAPGFSEALERMKEDLDEIMA